MSFDSTSVVKAGFMAMIAIVLLYFLGSVISALVTISFWLICITTVAYMGYYIYQGLK